MGFGELEEWGWYLKYELGVSCLTDQTHDFRSNQSNVQCSEFWLHENLVCRISGLVLGWQIHQVLWLILEVRSVWVFKLLGPTGFPFDSGLST
jgi:hypothetical protein